ncbi:hypothetical protein BGZ99_009084, partial [Dissophora globulifera]
MFAKPLNFISPLVVLLVASMTVEAFQEWCVCENSKLGRNTQNSCSNAGGKYDGGSCGMDSEGKVNSFSAYCAYNPNPKGHPNDAGNANC